MIDFKDISATALCIALFYWMAHLCGLVSFTQLDWSAGRKKPQCWLKENKFPEEIQKPLFAWAGGIFYMSDREFWEGHYIFIADIHISFCKRKALCWRSFSIELFTEILRGFFGASRSNCYPAACSCPVCKYFLIFSEFFLSMNSNDLCSFFPQFCFCFFLTEMLKA